MNVLDFNQHFEQALTFQKKRAYPQAIEAYQQVLKQYPTHLASRYNLGCLLAQQEQWETAIHELTHVIAQEPSCLPALYNLAICWQALQDDDKATEYLEKTLALDPKHPLANQALGAIFLKQQHFENAKAYLITALAFSPQDVNIIFNLALAFLGEGDKINALFYFSQLIKQNSAHIEAHYNCGVIYQQQGNYPAALRAYEKVLQLNSQHFASLYNSAIMLQATLQYEQALAYYQRANAIDPHHHSLPFLISALQHNSPNHAPTSYVETLFDQYADHYDRHMQQELQYQVPKKLFELFTKQVNSSPQQYSLVDLGCGTGLAGHYFKSLCHTLVGVDLSCHMLRMASVKNLYTTLNQQDNIQYLAKLEQEIDIIIAADVLGYYGDLNELLAAIKQALHPQGYCLFSIETHEDQDNFVLQSSARFSHSPSYMQTLAKKYGFDILASVPAALRTQQEKPVPGNLYLLSPSKESS